MTMTSFTEGHRKPATELVGKRKKNEFYKRRPATTRHYCASFCSVVLTSKASLVEDRDKERCVQLAPKLFSKPRLSHCGENNETMSTSRTFCPNKPSPVAKCKAGCSPYRTHVSLDACDCNYTKSLPRDPSSLYSHAHRGFLSQLHFQAVPALVLSKHCLRLCFENSLCRSSLIRRDWNACLHRMCF